MVHNLVVPQLLAFQTWEPVLSVKPDLLPSKRKLFFFPQIALAIGVLTLSWGGEGSQILWIRYGGGLSHRVSLEVSFGV